MKSNFNIINSLSSKAKEQCKLQVLSLSVVSALGWQIIDNSLEARKESFKSTSNNILFEIGQTLTYLQAFSLFNYGDPYKEEEGEIQFMVNKDILFDPKLEKKFSTAFHASGQRSEAGRWKQNPFFITYPRKTYDIENYSFEPLCEAHTFFYYEKLDTRQTLWTSDCIL